MASQIQINIETQGDFNYGKTNIPIQIEVADHKLKPILTQMTHTQGSPILELEPGTYFISASTPSGARVERVIEVVVELKEGEMQNISLPLYDISPHEDYEWAYMTQKPTPLSLPEEPSRQKELKEGWVRLWQSQGTGYVLADPAYEILFEGPSDRLIRFESVPEGVSCLQVGGPAVPWKCVAIPPRTACKILIQASSKYSKHPLDVTVASDNLALESLLAFLRRGQLEMASEIESGQARLAEELVFHKHQDPMAAAVGGYFLLRINDLERLHNWANNLANRFPWMPDGAIIHAWQLIAEYRQSAGADQDKLDQARERLIEAVARGFPIYSEGLRLLRDGLLLIDQQAEAKDPEIRAALNKAGAYYSAADLSTTTTTFLGETPYNPSPQPITGVPEDQTSLKYIFE